MNIIELDRWEPSADNPKVLERVGRRTGKEVFEELKQRLDSLGYLPDEYFLMDSHWENGREIPEDADLFCTTDYGGSEEIYLDVTIKWYEDHKPVFKNFITGKTLGETGADLDRMFLISSAITKAFHGDHGTYSRYMRVGGAKPPEDMILHLNPEEQRTFINALALQREQLLDNVDQTEKLLRRMTGSILSYMDEVGARPMRLSDEDKVSLAIRDGDIKAFHDCFLNALPHGDELLVQAAGRAGNVGREMTQNLLDHKESFSESSYLSACKNAVNIGDVDRVKTLMDQAEKHVPDLSPSFYGQVIQHCYSECAYMAEPLIDHCTSEQIAAAPSVLLYQAVTNRDYRSQYNLMKKGIDTNDRAADILHYLCCGHQQYEAKHLLRDGLKVEPDNFMSLHACVKNDAPEAAKAVLDQGMDYGQYRSWAVHNGYSEGSQEMITTLSEHWASLHPEQSQTQEQEAASIPGAPAKAPVSFCGERTSSEMSELSTDLVESEGYEACEDVIGGMTLG